MSDGSIANRADFSHLRYANVWEDAAILREALAIQPGDRTLCISSSGDNVLALLLDDPAEVVAVDLSPAQLATLALRIAAFRTLSHAELLELVGVRTSRQRPVLYARCRSQLDDSARAYWDAMPEAIVKGIGEDGKFERYLTLFRRFVLPLTQRKKTVRALLAGGGTPEARLAWYDEHWDTRLWRLVFGAFTSKPVMGRLGRDPSFLDHVEGSAAECMMASVRAASTGTDPATNPYLRWVLMGEYGDALPPYLAPEAFETIRDRVDRVTPVLGLLEDVLDSAPEASFGAFGLSDVFEYVDTAHAETVYRAIARAGRPGARLAYWNLLALRSRPEPLADQIRALPDLSTALHAKDRAPFYRAFVVEEVVGQ